MFSPYEVESSYIAGKTPIESNRDCVSFGKGIIPKKLYLKFFWKFSGESLKNNR